MTLTINTVDGKSVRIEKAYADEALFEIEMSMRRDSFWAEVQSTKDITNLIVLDNIANISISKGD